MNVPGFNTHSWASDMCRTCLQLGLKQNLPQAQIPVKKKNDGKVIIIISMVNILIDLYILTKFFHIDCSCGLEVTDR